MELGKVLDFGSEQISEVTKKRNEDLLLVETSATQKGGKKTVDHACRRIAVE
jgi:hypothetical protein